MHEFRGQDIDTMIEAALSSETMRSVPLDLHRKVEERVRFAALREQQRARFLLSMATLAAGFMATITAAAFILWITRLHTLFTNGVPGGKGQLDFYVNAAFRSLSEYSGTYTLLISLALATCTLLLAIAPLKKRALG